MRLSRIFAVALIGVVVAAACSGGAPGSGAPVADEASRPEPGAETVVAPQESAAAEPSTAPAIATTPASAPAATDEDERIDAPAEATRDSALRVALTIADETERAALAERFASRDEFAITP